MARPVSVTFEKLGLDIRSFTKDIENKAIHNLMSLRLE